MPSFVIGVIAIYFLILVMRGNRQGTLTQWDFGNGLG